VSTLDAIRQELETFECQTNESPSRVRLSPDAFLDLRDEVDIQDGSSLPKIATVSRSGQINGVPIEIVKVPGYMVEVE
jgi:hypothetical protein